MLISAIITGLIGLVCTILWITSMVRERDMLEGNGWYFALGCIFNFLWFITFLSALNFQVGTQHLSGYIYASETQVGYTKAHIRYSQNAGQDVQPSFCVKADSKPGRQITELTGSNKRVTVDISPYFYFSNNPYACGTANTAIKEIR